MNKMAKFTVNITLLFRPPTAVSPGFEALYLDLWKFAKLLDEKVDMPLGGWHPPAPKQEEALSYAAFDAGGPTADAIRLAQKYADARYADMPSGGAWNGKEGIGGAVFTTMYNPHGSCSMEFSATEFSSLKSYTRIADLVEGALQIWPATCIEVGPFKYFSQLKTFPERPGAGWILYLPVRIEIDQVPEARMLRHVKDLNGREGTIIVSEIDDVFSVDDPEQVRVANQIEIRLADQDLLPRYAEL